MSEQLLIIDSATGEPICRRDLTAVLSGATVPAATETVAGKVELATITEATTGIDTVRAVTPAGLKAAIAAIPPGSVASASETVAGAVELATIAEATAGTDTVRAVTPAGLKAAIAAAPSGVTVATQAEAVAGVENTHVMTSLRVKQAVSAYGLSKFAVGDDLPTTDIGPIWHDSYNSLMTWQTFNANGAAYTGYASIDIGRLVLESQPTPRAGWVKSGVSNLSKTAYAALWNWAVHNGIAVASGGWVAGELMYADNGDGTFRVADVRGEFPRFWDAGRGIDTGRAFGTSQGGTVLFDHVLIGWAGTVLHDGSTVQSAMQIHSQTNPATFNASVDAPVVSTAEANYYPEAAAESGSKVSIGTVRPRNTSFLAVIKF